MRVHKPLTDSAINAIAAGIFEKPKPLVLEAYSAPEHEPILFCSTVDLAAYIHDQVFQPRGLAFIFVVYPDMLGQPR